MDQFGIGRTLLMFPPSTLPEGVSLDDVTSVCGLKDLAGVVGGHPQRLAFLGGGRNLNLLVHHAASSGEVTPEMSARFEEVALEILGRGALGFGELAAEHFSRREGHPYESAPPDHPLFLLLADIAAANDVPIDLHMEAVPEDMPFDSITPDSRALGQPNNPTMLDENLTAFERLLDHNPRARIVWAHAGWDNTGARTVELMGRLLREHPNLYMHIKLNRGGIDKANHPLRGRGGVRSAWVSLMSSYPDRFVIGLDSFYAAADHLVYGSLDVRHIESTAGLLSQLPPGLARRVAHENATDIYRLDRP